MGEDVDKSTWLSQKQFARKFGVSPSTVITWRNKGYLTFDIIKLPNGGNGYLFPDLHPKKHQGYLEKLDKRRKKDRSIKNAVKKVIKDPVKRAQPSDKAKARLLPHYEKFLNESDPSKMFFTGPEVVKLLDIDTSTLYKAWKGMGLVRYKVPVGSKIGGAGARSADWVYTRVGLINFLSGDWDKKDGADEKLIASILGTGEGATDGYYHYDANNVYPFSGEGVIQWIKDKKIMFMDKRQNKWVPVKLWKYQEEFIKGGFSLRDNGDYQYNMIVASWERGEGKCEAFNTGIMMADGTVKKVQDIVPGDQVMGPNSKPRNVLNICGGHGEMYEVEPHKGERFTVNADHVLPLEVRKQKWVYPEGQLRKKENWIERENISLKDYMEKPSSYKNRAYVFSASVDFPHRDVFDPYFIGLWLGDGTSSQPHITTIDSEICDHVLTVARDLECSVTAYAHPTRCTTYKIVKYPSNRSNAALDKLRELNLLNNKHIPYEYKANSRENRLQLLAGLIDTDGSANRTGFEIIQKNKALAEDIAFLARSLGFHVNFKECQKGIKSREFIGTYYRLHINGNCSEVPTRIQRKQVPERKINKDILRSRIKSITPVGKEDFYGFTLDGDHLYIREDFSVSHNTFCCMLLFLFRFFNRYGEIINLSGLSKDQSSFAHYDLAKKTVLNTPMLNDTPGLEVKEKEIVLKAGPNDPVCTIKAVPTSTGLLPGTTCAVFTELHKLQDRQFFIDLWTSIRATPNSMILIDTTVAAKGHIVYNLWDSWCKKDDPLLYFSHKQDDIQNPETTPEHLASFRRHMLPFEFNRYFRNRWEDAVGGLFTPVSIEKKNYIGVKIDDVVAYGKSDELDVAIEDLVDGNGQANLYRNKGITDEAFDQKIGKHKAKLVKVDDIYSIPATREDKEKLEVLIGGPMTIGLGLDRSKLVGVMPDRTVFLCLGKIQIDFNTAYYFILDIFIPTAPSSMFLQNKLIEWETQYGYVDKVCAEEYQSQDFHLWCEEHGYESEFCSPTFKRQEEIFTNLFNVVNDGLFKTPTLPYYTDDEGNLHEGYSNKPDILSEEMEVFTHDGDKRFFGAPEKRKKAAVKDDIIYSLGWAGRACQAESMGEFMKSGDNYITLKDEPDDLIGEY